VLILAQWLFLGAFVAPTVEGTLAAANGAEVNVDSAKLSLLTGRLEIRGLQVTDPQRPEYNSFQAERVVADVSVADLMARRLVIDELRSENAVINTKKNKPGEVYDQEAKEKEPREPLDLAGFGGDKAKYLEKIKRTGDRLGKLLEKLKSEDRAQTEPSRGQLVDEAEARGYLGLSAVDYLIRQPSWVIRELHMEVDPEGGIPPFTLKGENLSSHPSLYSGKARLYPEPDWEAFNRAIRGDGGEEPSQPQDREGGNGLFDFGR